jgi:hypothetical protein
MEFSARLLDNSNKECDCETEQGTEVDHQQELCISSAKRMQFTGLALLLDANKSSFAWMILIVLLVSTPCVVTRCEDLFQPMVPMEII